MTTKFSFSTLVVLLAGLLQVNAAPGVEKYHLRAYGDLSVEELNVGGKPMVKIHASDAAHAKVLYSKILSDFTNLPTVTAKPVTVGKTKLTALVFDGGRRLLPVLKEKSSVVDVYLFDKPSQWEAFEKSGAAEVDGAVQWASSAHPMYFDLWDRRNMGFWYSLGFKTLTKDRNDEQDFEFLKKFDLNVNSIGPSALAISLRCDRDHLGFKLNRWFSVNNFIYDVFPEATCKGDPDTTTSPSYYGDVPIADNPLKKVQVDESLQYLSQIAGDDNLMAITDQYGESAGNPEYYFDGFLGRDEASRQDLIAYLRDFRKLTLEELGERWYSNPDQFKSWEAVQFPRERDFYGWEDGKSQSLAGIWKFRTAKRDEGENEKVFDAGYDDSKWFSYHFPGSQYLVNSPVGQSRISSWTRTRFVPDPALLKAGSPIYLTVCPMANSPYTDPCTVYLNGNKIADLTFGHGREWGQIDVTKLLKPGQNSLAAYVYDGPILGPVFLTLNKAETSYPSSNPCLNARRFDLREWVANASVHALTDSFKNLRGIDPYRGIKLMAPHDIMDIGTPAMAKWGVYPHCTGEGAYFRPWARRNGCLFGMMASSESAASATDLNQLKKYFFCLTFEGTGVFDYFYHLHDILIHPDKKDWYEKNVDYYKLAGRFDLKKPDVAIACSLRNDRYGVKNGSYHRNDFGRGDLQQAHFSYVYCFENNIASGLANQYKVMVDDNLCVVEESDVDALEAYVKQGGTLILNQRSGRDTYLKPGTWPIRKLTGCEPAIRPQEGTLTFEPSPSILKSYAGKTFQNYGEVVDWQQRNYFDDSISLELKEKDIEVIARYQDGKPAIVVRTLGAGKVVVLGSSFYRKSSDVSGFYVGSDEQTAFLQALFTDLGVQPLVTSGEGRLWSERFVANNGSTEMLVLGNQSGSVTIPQASAVWDLGFSPARVFDPVTGKDVLTKIEGNKVSIDIHDLPPFEMRYYAVERSDLSAGQAVKCWLNRQLDLWKAVPEVEKPSFKQNPTCPIFLYGKYEVKQFDDESAARKALSSQGNLSDGWTKSFPADWASAGLKQATQLWAVYQKAFEIDPAWLKNLRRAELARTDSRSFWDNVVEIQLNGQVVSSGEKMTNQEKILSLLKPGKNSISILAKADKDGNGGFIGEIVLLRVPGSSDQTVLPLNKEWTVYPSFVDGQVVDLPRSGTWTLARKQVQIPDRFRDCSVWMEVEGKGCVVSTNGRSRYNSNIFGSQIHSQPTLVNITPDIRFGEENEIVLASRYTALKPYPMDLRDVKLIFIPKK